MIRFLLSRIGCLMMIFGIIVFVVGVAAAQSGEPALTLLFVGFVGSAAGFLVWNRLRERPPRNTRFSIFRKRDRREEQRTDDGWEDHFDD